jgi:hypothetical protein
MEVVGILLSLVFLYSLYHVIRVAVRDGMREALKSKDAPLNENDAER